MSLFFCRLFLTGAVKTRNFQAPVLAKVKNSDSSNSVFGYRVRVYPTSRETRILVLARSSDTGIVESSSSTQVVESSSYIGVLELKLNSGTRARVKLEYCDLRKSLVTCCLKPVNKKKLLILKKIIKKRSRTKITLLNFNFPSYINF